MSSRNLAVEHLTADNRRLVDAWLSAFDAAWDETQLAQRISQLPPDLSLRWPMLLGLVGIDLRRRWAASLPAKVEEYLARFPEIGSRDTVPVSLLQAEYMARAHAGDTPSWEEYEARFPRHVAELRRLVEQSVVETGQDALFATAAEPRQMSSEVVLAPSVVGEQKVPDQLGRYQVLRRLGKGGMGSVYLAHDTQLDREVALKVPNFREDEDEENLRRFFREARAAAKIEHPNICPIYDVGEIDGIRYLTMAYVKGKPLSAFLQLGKPVKVTNAVAVVRKLALALAQAHQKGIIHRDLKPSNIMLNQQSEPVLLDFGMAREVFSDQSRLTHYGNLAGTPAYMSPEQVKGDLGAMGPNCDIYALGVLLYQMLTGHLPYEGETFTVLAKLLTQDPPSPQEHRPHLDAEICRITMKAMAREISDRYQSMQEFAHALTGYLRRASTASKEFGSRDNVPAVRDVTPVQRQPQVNADGTLDLIYFEAANPGAAAALERTVQERLAAPKTPPPALPDPFATPDAPPYSAPPVFAPASPLLPLPAPAVPAARQTMLAPMRAPSSQDLPPLTMPPVTALAPEAAPPPQAAPAAANDYTKLIWILGSAAVGLLLMLVIVLVLLLNRPDEAAKAKTTRPAPTVPAVPPLETLRQADWRAFTPPGSNSSILMPGPPAKDPGREQFQVAVGRARYSFFWGDKDSALNTVKDMEKALDEERQRILGLLRNSSLLKEDKLTLDGHPGRYWEVQGIPEGQQEVVTFYIRCYQAGKRQFVMYVTFPLHAAKDAEPKKFFDSFRLQ